MDSTLRYSNKFMFEYLENFSILSLSFISATASVVISFILIVKIQRW